MGLPAPILNTKHKNFTYDSGNMEKERVERLHKLESQKVCWNIVL